MILLIHPPLVKPSEPPPGTARLYGALRAAGAECDVIDANIEGIRFLLGKTPNDSDKWTLRAVRNRERNLQSIRNRSGYSDLQRYKRIVSDVGRLLEKSVNNGVRIGLSNYNDVELSPVRSRDLLRAAEENGKNPFHPYFSRRLTDAIERDAPEVVGLSLNFLSQALTAFSMIGFLRANFPEIRIVLGGGLVTSWVRKPGWINPFSGLVDDIVDGPGERALLEIAGKVPAAPGKGKSCANAPQPGLFLPAYDPFPMHEYFAPGAILPYSTSSGCYWNRCAFCPEKAEKTPYDPIPAQTALIEAASLVKDVRPVLLHFTDSALSPALLRKITEAPPGAPWYGFVRITRSLANEDFCRALKKSGCVMLKLGLESGDQGVIDSEGKGIDLGIASRALASIKKAGIGTYGYFLFGTPSEAEAKARNTLDFVVNHHKYIDFLNLAIFNMPINSPDAERFGTSPHYEGDLSLYTGFTHPRGWNRAQVRQFLDKEFKRHPAIGPILAKDPPHFTSNHAPFFCG